MKIAATMIGMDAAHSYTEVALGSAGPFIGRPTSSGSERTVNFGERFSSLISTLETSSQTTQSPEVAGAGAEETGKTGQEPPLNEQLVSELTGALTGHSVSVRSVSSSFSAHGSFGMGASLHAGTASITGVSMYTEVEMVQFSASGSVRTEDGRSIGFQLGLEMERSTSVINARGARLQPFIDPLVLNFGDGLPFEGDSFFTFDLDADGEDEKVCRPGSGCGFLAFDRNLDGMVNDGLELFGPGTGFGFDELAAFDQDANLWIDENDPIFDQLSVWMQGAEGEDELLSLRDAGVGAISIAHAGTGFILEDAGGKVLGRVKGSGIFLTESGEVRSLQEVDLADQNEEPATDVGAGAPLEAPVREAMDELRAIIDRQLFSLKMMTARRRTAMHNDLLFRRLQEQLQASRFNSDGNSAAEEQLTDIINQTTT